MNSVTGARKLVESGRLDLCSATLSVASSGICNRLNSVARPENQTKEGNNSYIPLPTQISTGTNLKLCPLSQNQSNVNKEVQDGC